MHYPGNTRSAQALRAKQAGSVLYDPAVSVGLVLACITILLWIMTIIQEIRKIARY
jgi:hypothetical protein